jgi:4-aminobutyrate aminotransferase/(S)-3-amino-2-methylpropionate transaminase
MRDHPSRTADLLALREKHIPRGIASTHPIFLARAQGALLWDIDEREYIDFAAGIGVLNVGHNHPKVIRTVQAQLERLTHTCFQVAMYEPYLRLAERLNQLAPGEAPKKTIFLTTGAEAVENAIKIAREATRRPAVIAFSLSFHGRTLMGLSLTGKATAYRQHFGPFAPEVYHTPYPYTYRGWSSARALDALQELFHTQVTPDQVAAIIIEPVAGEGGFIPAPPEFLQELRRVTEQHGIVLIADEIQTGFGRTGKLFAVEHAAIAPDLITSAKSLAGGLPLSGVIGRADIMDAPSAGGLGGTYGGNPLACAAGLAVLDIFEQEHLLVRAERLGNQLMERCRALQSEVEAIGDVRGLGAMIGIELVRNRQTKEPAPELVDQILVEARNQGVLLIKAGLYGNVIRLLAPLMIEEQLALRALDTLSTVIKQVVQRFNNA